MSIVPFPQTESGNARSTRSRLACYMRVPASRDLTLTRALLPSEQCFICTYDPHNGLLVHVVSHAVIYSVLHSSPSTIRTRISLHIPRIASRPILSNLK